MLQKIIEKIRYELQFDNTSYYTRISDKIIKKTYQFILRKKLGSLQPIIINKENAKLTLATVANKKRFYESVAALYSFCFWKRDIKIHYHEDGTLTQTEIKFLKKIFPGITIFIKSEQDLQIKENLLLKGLVNCANVRDCFFLSIKLFDMIAKKDTLYLLHIDSDVLFFEKPNEILDIIDKENLNGCYNVDVLDAKTFDNETISKYINAPMIEMFNSGLLLHNFDESMFYFIEKFMEDHLEATSSWHLEQTLLGMYASDKGGFLALPKNYDLGRVERRLGNKLTSEHYVHNTGYDFHKDFINKLYPIFKK